MLGFMVRWRTAGRGRVGRRGVEKGTEGEEGEGRREWKVANRVLMAHM